MQHFTYTITILKSPTFSILNHLLGRYELLTINQTSFHQLCLSFTLALLALMLTWTTLAHADGPGDLDTTFNGTGVVTTSIGAVAATKSVAVYSDDKIVAAGFSSSGGNGPNFAVVRYLEDGQRDDTFNDTGIVTTSVGGDFESGTSVAIQSDDKIVVVGYTESNNKDNFALVRYTITGSLDTDFKNNGIVTTAISDNDDWATSVALQPDEKIIVSGTANENSGDNGYSAIVRYNSNGDLDLDFNGTGIVTGPIGTDVAIQPDGRIIVAGSYKIAPSKYKFGVMRHTISGTVDTAFGNAGVITTPIGNASDYGNSVAIQPDGKIVVAGTSEKNDALNQNIAIVRYTGDGNLDPTFNGTGIITTSIGDTASGWSVNIQSDGKIVVGGYSSKDGISYDVTLVRYNSDGSLDTGFGSSGIVTTTSFVSGIGTSGPDIGIQPNGKIVLADVTNDFRFAIARYLGDPILNLTKAVSHDNPTPGQQITYTIIVSNSGSTGASNALISDTLPTGLTLAGPVTIDPPGIGTIGSIPKLVSELTISPGKQITISIPVTISLGLQAAIILTNTTTVSSNEVASPVMATAIITIANNPMITVTKRVNDSIAEVNEIITYTYRVTNTGNVTLNPVTASDDRLGTIALTKSILYPDEWTIGTLTYTIVGNDYPGPLTNTVTVTGSPSTGLPVTASDMEVITIQDTQAPTFPTNALITPTQSIVLNTSQPILDWKDARDDVRVVSYTLSLTGSNPLTGILIAEGGTALVASIDSIFTPTVDLPNAIYTWTVAAYDAAGNVGSVISPAHFVIDTSSNVTVHLPIILKNK